MATDVSETAALPLPPAEMRCLVGLLEDSYFDNPAGELVFAALPADAYDSVLDFGCGRIARQLIQQRPRPRSCLGLDLHRGMIGWCQQNLAPHAPGFRFQHHDVHHPALNPDGQRQPLVFPLDDRSVRLTWFLFDKASSR